MRGDNSYSPSDLDYSNIEGDGLYHVYGAGYYKSNNTRELRVDGFSQVQNDLNSINFTSSQDTIIGSGHYDRYIQGNLKEVLYYQDTELDNKTIIKIQSYLSNKWNLTSTVDSDGDGIVDASDPFPTDPSKWISFPQALRDNASDNFTAMNGLALWLDATNIDGGMNSSLSDGDAVGVWNDLSGTGNSGVQTVETEKPKFNA